MPTRLALVDSVRVQLTCQDCHLQALHSPAARFLPEPPQPPEEASKGPQLSEQCACIHGRNTAVGQELGVGSAGLRGSEAALGEWLVNQDGC